MSSSITGQTFFLLSLFPSSLFHSSLSRNINASSPPYFPFATKGVSPPPVFPGTLSFPRTWEGKKAPLLSSLLSKRNLSTKEMPRPLSETWGGWKLRCDERWRNFCETNFDESTAFDLYILHINFKTPQFPVHTLHLDCKISIFVWRELIPTFHLF